MSNTMKATFTPACDACGSSDVETDEILCAKCKARARRACACNGRHVCAVGNGRALCFDAAFEGALEDGLSESEAAAYASDVAIVQALQDDLELTVRIPAETMAALVFGGAR